MKQAAEEAIDWRGLMFSETFTWLSISWIVIGRGVVMADARYARGLKKLEEIDGEAGKKVIDSLKDIAPDLARYTIEFPFGDVYSRKGLDVKSREIATIAALTALGNAAPQLKVHIHAGLNVGLNPEEVTEIIIQMAVYAGFPAALNGMFAAKEVFKERGISIKQPGE
ncbi:MAG TPA: carboxymuconolactone decarboxylase family protein [Dissulfurispiraceae bacterium]|nr:carboxymuconolactone decarboxylase family protein [Dissulfurispiraceae bacterium]